MALAAVAAPAAASDITIRDLVEVADISALAVSPDGRLIAFRVERPSVARDRVAVTWYVQPVDGSAPARDVADGGEAIFTSAGAVAAERPRWSRDGRTLYFRADWDGDIQIWRAAVDGRGAERVTADAGNILSFELAPDGDRIDFRVGPDRDAVDRAERDVRRHGVRVDASVDLALGVSGGRLVDGRSISQRLRGDWFGRRGLLEDQPPRDRSVVLAERETSDLPIAVPAESHCLPELCGGAQPLWVVGWPGGKAQLAALVDDSGRSSVRLAAGGDAPISLGAGQLLAGSRDPTQPCVVAAETLLCVAAGAAAPPQLVRIDPDDPNRERVLYDPNAALRARIRTRVRALEWQAGGVAFAGWLLLPPEARGAHPPALVIHYYRCDGFLRGGIGDELPMHVLAQDGMAVLCINAPSIRRPHPDAVANYRLAREGISTVVASLAAEGRIDRNRVGMQGLSFGSEATMWVLRHTNLLKAASIASTQLEPSYYWFNAVQGRDFAAALERQWGLGDPDVDRARWRALSAALDTKSIGAPLLMQLPESEARMSIELFARLARSPVPVELYAYPGAPHIKIQPAQKQAVYARNLDWFRFWLDGAADTDPAKAEQYDRWRVMALRWRQRDDATRP